MEKKDLLIARSIEFLEGLKNKTPGTELEDSLNDRFGPGSETFESLSGLVIDGVNEGWAATEEIEGPHYRRGRLLNPCAETFYFSITVVYMESGPVFRGDYHAHPYGEINLITPVTPGAVMNGPNGWCAGGWTSPAPGSHHYPEVRDGDIVVLPARGPDFLRHRGARRLG